MWPGGGLAVGHAALMRTETLPPEQPADDRVIDDELLTAAVAFVPPMPPTAGADDLRVDHLDTPIGRFRLLARDGALCGLHLVDADTAEPPSPWRPAAGHLDAARRELGEYFAGTRDTFTIPLDLAGTAFQQEVWGALTEIPYGATASYGELARAVGRPGAARAVGAANRRNPVAVIVPCHRVIGAGGGLTGYGLGLPRKAWLLDHERRHGDAPPLFG
jgi:methylated-DNA-[protein]-cysteine S-methyltransferase